MAILVQWSRKNVRMPNLCRAQPQLVTRVMHKGRPPIKLMQTYGMHEHPEIFVTPRESSGLAWG